MVNCKKAINLKLYSIFLDKSSIQTLTISSSDRLREKIHFNPKLRQLFVEFVLSIGLEKEAVPQEVLLEVLLEVEVPQQVLLEVEEVVVEVVEGLLEVEEVVVEVVEGLLEVEEVVAEVVEEEVVEVCSYKDYDIARIWKIEELK